MNVVLSARAQRWLWGVLAMVVGVRLATLGAYPLLDPSEARYAEIARKMLETGDWLVPQFEYGVPFWGKPPLSFWLSALSMGAFGVNEFAVRLPSLLLMAGCAAVVWRMARVHAGRASALLATTVFATMGLVFVAGGAVLTDIALTLGTTLSMAGFWAAVRGPGASQRLGAAALFAGLVVGLLSKGPIAAVLTLFPIAVWTLWQRALHDAWTRVPWLAGTALTAALVAPWYWAVEQATPGYLEYFLIGEHWQRFTQPGWTGDLYGAGHQWRRGWIWLFWVAAALPWSVVMLDWLVRCFAAPRARLRERTADPFWRYLAVWALAPLVFFTLSRNILPSYVLPGLPAFALLIAYGPFAVDLPRPLDRAERRGLVTGVLMALAFLVVLAIAQERIAHDFTQRALVRSFERMRDHPDQRLVYLGDMPVSAEFYMGGKVKRAVNGDELAPYLADAAIDFVVMRERDAAGLPPELRARLAPVGRFGEFELFREAPPGTVAPTAP